MKKPTSGVPGKGRKHRTAHLSDDDATEWEHTAQSLAPLRKAKARVHPALADDDADALFAIKEPVAERHSRTSSEKTAGKAGGVRPASATAPRPARKTPELQPFDSKRARRLKTGRAEIEARFDLHGMVQTEAHARLRAFLKSCHANGLRTVLVITGKGGTAGARRRGEDEDVWGRGLERGILKRAVPQWLAEADLRRIVVSYTDAAIQHGGEGAIYIHLRSASKVGG